MRKKQYSLVLKYSTYYTSLQATLKTVSLLAFFITHTMTAPTERSSHYTSCFVLE